MVFCGPLVTTAAEPLHGKGPLRFVWIGFDVFIVLLFEFHDDDNHDKDTDTYT